MYELYVIKKYFPIISFAGVIFLLLFIILMCGTTSGGSEDNVASIYLVAPFNQDVSYVITSNFGERIDPFDSTKTSFHKGIDLVAPDGTDIVSSGDGVVIQSGNTDSLGNYVVIEHNISNLKLYTLYAHMLDDSVVVKKGDNVKVYDKLGIIGNTGRSTGTHLHFMISIYQYSYDEKYLINPINVINRT